MYLINQAAYLFMCSSVWNFKMIPGFLTYICTIVLGVLCTFSDNLGGTGPYPEPVVFQWQSSGNPVCLELRAQCTLECHWRMPVCFQWSSSGFPVVFQCVPIMQINTGSPLRHHWVLASASVVPVASQCTCGSSGLPGWSFQWYPSVLTESDLEVIRSSHFPACHP